MSEHVQLTPSHDIYGVLAEFDSPEELITACERAYAGRVPAHGCLRAYPGGWPRGGGGATRKNYVANCVLAAGITGVLFGFGTARMDRRTWLIRITSAAAR